MRAVSALRKEREQRSVEQPPVTMSRCRVKAVKLQMATEVYKGDFEKYDEVVKEQS